jgi:hypothetical protein
MRAKSLAGPMGSASGAGTFFEALERPENSPSDGPSKPFSGLSLASAAQSPCSMPEAIFSKSARRRPKNHSVTRFIGLR